MTMQTYLVTATGTVVYQVEVQGESEEDARLQAEYEAGEGGEAFLKSGELQDAWIEIDKAEPKPIGANA
jgi:hypothetical protein